MTERVRTELVNIANEIEKLGGGSMGSTNYNEPIPPTSDYDDVPF